MNPCTVQQFEKFPDSSDIIFTSHRIWRRFYRTVDNSRLYERTSAEFKAVQEELLTFRWTENTSPVVLMLGELNVTTFPKSRNGMISIQMPGPRMYQKRPKSWLVIDSVDISIPESRHSVVPSREGLSKSNAGACCPNGSGMEFDGCTEQLAIRE